MRYLSPDKIIINKPESLMVFKDVNIIPMDQEGIIKHQNVFIQNGVIKKILNAGEESIPREAIYINGSKGKYLIAGLADMHVHIVHSNDLLLFISKGITTVRNMGSFYAGKYHFHLRLKNKVNNQEVIGPQIYTAGSMLCGSTSMIPLICKQLKTKDDIRRVILKEKQAGYDFIKIHDGLSLAQYSDVLRIAHESGMDVAGHLPDEVTLNSALNLRQRSIEHLMGYINAFKDDWVIKKDEIDQYIRTTKEHDVWNCPTMISFQRIQSFKRSIEFEEEDELKLVPPLARWLWRYFTWKRDREGEKKGYKYPQKCLPYVKETIQKLYEANCNLLLGTDTHLPYIIPGFATHRELENLVSCGISPYQALKTATYNAAKFLNKLDEFGTVSEGKRADLILLDQNPLDNIHNMKTQLGVMVNGRWITQISIENILQEIRNHYRLSII
ncbi:hypothetical protein DESME_07755 [Desulfitobacterium metallireducens DSM 15288]|uniref:Amidohydrolase-related domain-containing protein n=2 Tax=Desulfitobacterium TaxID=36853 RepID=W0ECC5_9FIRM|nr:hypothetical protein DESME_07755 [Desulfitobacterium metallireducens DSM 15288]